MKTSTLNKILVFLIILVLGWNIYSVGENYQSILSPLIGQQNPCQKTLTYSIGSIDSQFNISEQDFLEIIETAAEIWNEPAGKKLFAYAPDGKLKINLIYDDRQESTLKLKNIDTNISSDRATYDKLKNEYTVAVATYNQQNLELQNKIYAYNTQKNNYEQQVFYWQSKGGAPQPKYEELEKQRIALNAAYEEINQLTNQVNSLGTSINIMADNLNQLITKLNLNIDNYNDLGEGEFEQGVYISDINGQKINIYQYNNKNKLIRVMAHELGHALGLNHSDFPSAIMYSINQDTNLSLTADDLAALKNVCKIE